MLAVAHSMPLADDQEPVPSRPSPPRPDALPAGLNVLVIGDSNTEIGHLTGGLARRFEAAYGYFGSGYHSLNDTIGMGSGYLPYLKIANVGAWQKPAMVQPGAPKPYVAPDGAYVVGTSPGLQTEISFYGTAIDLYWLATAGGGQFTLAVDDLPLQTVATGLDGKGCEVRKTRIDGLSAANHRLTLTVQTAPTTLLGLDTHVVLPYEHTRRAVVHKWGKGWATTQDFVDIDPNIFQGALRLLDPDVAVVILGTNDHNLAGHNRDQYADGLREIVGRIRTATPATRVLVLSTFQVNSPWSNHGLREYRGILPELCRELGAFYWDMSAWFGENWGQANQAGWMADAVHANAAGGERIAEQLETEIHRLVKLVNPEPEPPATATLTGAPPPTNALPGQIGGLVAWWRADGPMAVDPQGRVLRWLDNSDHGADAIAPWPWARPQRLDGTGDGRATLRFDGQHSHLRFPLQDKAQTILAVFRARHLLLGHPYFNSRPFHPGVVRPGKAFSANYASASVTGGRGFLDGRPVHLGDDQEEGLEFSAEQLQLFSLVMDKPTPFSYLGWGGSWNFDKYMDGEVAELIVYNRALTDQERQNLESDLAARWQIPLAPADGR